MATVTRAWVILIALSAASTMAAAAVSAGNLTGTAAKAGGAIVLFIAWGKARTILNAYLRLDEAPTFRRGFGLTLALYSALLLGLYWLA